MFKVLVERRKRLAVFTAVMLVFQTILAGLTFAPSRAYASASYTWDFNPGGGETVTPDTGLGMFDYDGTSDGALQFKLDPFDNGAYGIGLETQLVKWMTHLVVTSSGRIWGVTNTGFSLYSDDNGVNWTATADAILKNMTVKDIIDLGSGKLVAVSTNLPYAAYSSDSGSSWAAGVFASAGTAFAAAAWDVNTSTAYALGANKTLYDSSDNGANWDITAVAVSVDPNRVTVASDLICYGTNLLVAVGAQSSGDAGLDYLTVGGVGGWAVAPIPTPPASSMLLVSYVNGWIYAGAANYLINLNTSTGALDTAGDWNDLSANVDVVSPTSVFNGVGSQITYLTTDTASGYTLYSTLDNGGHWFAHETETDADTRKGAAVWTQDGSVMLWAGLNTSNAADIWGASDTTASTSAELQATSNNLSIDSISATYHSLNYGGVARIQFSADASTWYYYDTAGGAWTTATDTLTEATQINDTDLSGAILTTMPIRGQVSYFRVYPNSTTSTLILDSLTINYATSGGGGGGGGQDLTAPVSQVVNPSSEYSAANPCAPLLHVTATAYDVGGGYVAQVTLAISTDGVHFVSWADADTTEPYAWDIPVTDGQTYYLYSIATDSSGNVEDPPTEGWDTFTTIDASPPHIEFGGSDPMDNDTNVPITQPVVLNFNETMLPDSAQYEFETVTTPAVPVTGVALQWSNNNQTLTVTHDPLAYSTKYRFKIQATDRAGNNLIEQPARCGGGRIQIIWPPVEFFFTTVDRQDPDLRSSTLTVADGPNQDGSYNPGDNAIYTLRLENSSTHSADNVTVTITFPAGITFVGINGADTHFRTTEEGGVVTGLVWTGSLAGYDAGNPNANVIVSSYTMRVDSPATELTISQTATVNDGVNPSFETQPPAVLHVMSQANFSTSTKTVEPSGPAQPGMVLTYTITVINTGTTTTDMQLSDYLPLYGDSDGDFFYNLTPIIYDHNDTRWSQVPHYDTTTRTLGGTAHGLLPNSQPMILSFDVVLRGNLPEKDVFNTAYVWDPNIMPLQKLELKSPYTHVPGGDAPGLEISYKNPPENSDDNGFKQNIEIGFNSSVDLTKPFEYSVTEAGYEVNLDDWNPTWSDFNGGLPNALLTLTPPDPDGLAVGAVYEITISAATNVYNNLLVNAPVIWHFTTADPVVKITTPTDQLLYLPVGQVSVPFTVKLIDSLSNKEYLAEENVAIGLKAYLGDAERTTGIFLSAPDKPLGQNAHITIPQGSSMSTFYYEDAAVSTPDYITIRVFEDPYRGWPDDEKYVEVTAGEQPLNGLKMNIGSTSVKVGQYSNPIDISAKSATGRTLTLPDRLYFYSTTTTGAFYDTNQHKLPYLVTVQNDDNGMPQYLDTGGSQTGVIVYFKSSAIGLVSVAVADDYPQWPDNGLANVAAVMNVYKPQEEELLTDLEEVTDDSGRVIDHVDIKPTETALLPNGTQTFTAVGYDTDGRVIENLKFKWHVLIDESGTIELNGSKANSGITTFTASDALGTYYDDVLVATLYNGTIGYAVAKVTIADVVDYHGPKRLPVTGMNGLQLVLLGLTLAAAVALAWVEHYDKTHFKPGE